MYLTTDNTCALVECQQRMPASKTAYFIKGHDQENGAKTTAHFM